MKLLESSDDEGTSTDLKINEAYATNYNRFREKEQYQKLKDKYGETIITQLNEDVLDEIAEAGNGFFVRATNANSGLNEIFDEISGLEKTELGTKLYTDYEDRYPYFLALSLLPLFFYLYISNKTPKWKQKIALFK